MRMKWFTGSIPDAIKLAKSKGSLFVVYVFGQEEMSQEMEKSWESTEVTEAMNDVVAIRISNTSDDCKHFSQIYPVVVVPATFCIGENGVPLEVIGGPLKPADLVDRIEQVQQMHEVQKQSLVAPSGSQSSSQSMSQTSAEATGGTEVAGASGDQGQATPIEDKVERAKELMEKRRIEKAQQEYEKSKEEEVKRRKLGQDLQKLKQNQQEMQMKELKDQMRKDKEDEKKAREKIRQQIARDREERQARFEKEKQDRENAVEEKKREKLQQQQAQAAAEEARKSESARIQVRLPDGSSLTQTFSSTQPLQALHDFVQERMGGGDISLSLAYPKRQFTAEDLSASFADLQLAPSAVVLALPVRRSTTQASSSTSSGGGIIQAGGGILSLIFTPFLFVWNLLYTFLFGRGSNSTESSQASSSQSEEPRHTLLSTNRPTTAYQRRSVPSGNTRRLADLRDDDDDMSTYNGNSTQQL